ncbi:MAG: hypothetical protein HOP15_12505, partial [Planctomycetes bacterium]|nr:hypothetical protein [Planctomycetota bacterium]
EQLALPVARDAGHTDQLAGLDGEVDVVQANMAVDPVHGHAADGSPNDLVLAQSAKEILPAADGSLMRAMWLTLATHGSVGHFLGWEVQKAMAILASHEPADNVNWYYFAERSRVLRLSPGFALVLAFGLVGLLLERRRGPDERLLRWFLLATFLGLLYGTLAARYRLVAVVVLMVYAAAALARAGESVRARRWAPAAGILLTACALAFGSTRLYADVHAARSRRLTEPMLAALTYQQRRQPELALLELRAGLAHAWREPGARTLSNEGLQLAALLVRVAAKSGRGAEVQADVDGLVAEFADDWQLHRLAADYYREVLPQPQRAAEHLAMAERLRPRQGAQR